MRSKGQKSIKERIVENLIFKPLKLLPLEDTIVFESHSDFCDNSKALFDRMIEKNINEDYKIYWLVEDIDNFKSLNIENVEFVSIERKTIFQKIISEFKNAIILSKCKYYFFSHRNFSRSVAREGQVYFNLTHGMSLKDTTGIYKDGYKDTYILTTSEFTRKLRSKTYNVSESKLKILGFPRNDLFFRNKDSLKSFNIDKEDYNKVIIWMPTFRRQKNFSRNDTGSTDDSDLPILKNEKEMLDLDRYLTNKEILFVIKPHPAQDMRFFKSISSNNIKMITNDDMISRKVELYELLGESDGLITDYSSVYIDYLILDKPIGFTIDDLENYSENLGFLVDNPLEYMPGMKIKKFKDMIDFITTIYNDKDIYRYERNCISKLFNKYNDDKSADRIIDFVGLINKNLNREGSNEKV